MNLPISFSQRFQQTLILQLQKYLPITFLLETGRSQLASSNFELQSQPLHEALTRNSAPVDLRGMLWPTSSFSALILGSGLFLLFYIESVHLLREI